MLLLALGCAVLALLPSLYALLAAPPGSLYLGTQWATDDHMVYASWTRQAMEGQFLFDNRFTTDDQPGLTIQIYFWAVGQIARLAGVTLALLIAKVVLSYAFVWLAYRFVRRLTQDPLSIRLALILTVFGGGIGYLVWQRFGLDITVPRPEFLNGLMFGRLPTDVWQPEGFVFPSMLTTGLFVAALCLILIVFSAFLDARESWKAVWKGSLAMLVLMNIHSYDVLLVALVMGGFLVMCFARGQVTKAWLVRSVAIAAGAIPSALWFMYVLNNDPVFRERALTPTYAPNFRQFIFGYLILIILGLVAVLASRSPRMNESGGEGRGEGKAAAGAALAGGMVIGLFAGSSGHIAGYWMTLPVWIGLYIVVLAILWLLAREESGFNLVLAWAFIGLIAPYFPGLFQRKLAMGLVIPWAILAALALAMFAAKMIPRQRALVIILIGLLACGSSALWLQRDFSYVRDNVSRTTVHPVYLSKGDAAIIEALAKEPGRKVVLAKPGSWNPLLGPEFRPIPDAFDAPLTPDLNAVACGLAGAYTYAGHWSETPEYTKKREEISIFFSPALEDAQRASFAKQVRATHIIAPKSTEQSDLSRLGKIIVQGDRFDLVRLP